MAKEQVPLATLLGMFDFEGGWPSGVQGQGKECRSVSGMVAEPVICLGAGGPITHESNKQCRRAAQGHCGATGSD